MLLQTTPIKISTNQTPISLTPGKMEDISIIVKIKDVAKLTPSKEQQLNGEIDKAPPGS